MVRRWSLTPGSSQVESSSLSIAALWVSLQDAAKTSLSKMALRSPPTPANHWLFTTEFCLSFTLPPKRSSSLWAVWPFRQCRLKIMWSRFSDERCPEKKLAGWQNCFDFSSCSQYLWLCEQLPVLSRSSECWIPGRAGGSGHVYTIHSHLTKISPTSRTLASEKLTLPDRWLRLPPDRLTISQTHNSVVVSGSICLLWRICKLNQMCFLLVPFFPICNHAWFPP